ncbi:Uncharacterized protein pbN1_06280 [Aromatoleum bremense]|nr:Uncharacterized protein pbN1_06280 [Aromatoleum bremense]
MPANPLTAVAFPSAAACGTFLPVFWVARLRPVSPGPAVVSAGPEVSAPAGRSAAGHCPVSRVAPACGALPFPNPCAGRQAAEHLHGCPEPLKFRVR